MEGQRGDEPGLTWEERRIREHTDVATKLARKAHGKPSMLVFFDPTRLIELYLLPEDLPLTYHAMLVYLNEKMLLPYSTREADRCIAHLLGVRKDNPGMDTHYYAWLKYLVKPVSSDYPVVYPPTSLDARDRTVYTLFYNNPKCPLAVGQ